MKLCNLFEDKSEKDWAGIFIRLPSKFNKEFPNKKEDESPQHITMLYVGDVNKETYDNTVKIVKGIASRIKPFKVQMTDYGEFTAPDGKVIPHMIPRGYEISLDEIHRRLMKAFDYRNIKVSQCKGPFKPHTTLKYISKNETYKGPKPNGSWTVKELEVWSDKFGNTKIPLKM